MTSSIFKAHPRPAVCLAASVAIVFSCLGCSDREIQQRIDATVADLQQHSPGHGAIAMLKTATPQSIRDPDIVFIRLLPRAIAVDWLEAAPTADALELSGPDGLRRVLPMDPAYMGPNARAAERFVMYSATWIVPNDLTPEFLQQLKVPADKGQLTGRLVRSGVPVGTSVKAELRRQTPAGADLSKGEFNDGLRQRLWRLRERMNGPATSTSPPREHLVVYSRVMLHVGLESVRPWGPQHTGEALLAYLEDTSENPRHSSVFPGFDQAQWRNTPWTWRRILELLDQLEPES